MTYACFSDSRWPIDDADEPPEISHGCSHPDMATALKHAGELNNGGAKNAHVAHEDGSRLTMEEIDSSMSPDARRLMNAIGRSFLSPERN